MQVEGDDVGRDLWVRHDDADIRVGREHVDERREPGVAHLHELEKERMTLILFDGDPVY